ncbi:uncharacterized protein PFLUO_LOCUS4716 [Penicillium psychrofluorescens]|uniref:uncharacterized protein n=1 Tax=Penicillium psychrofluorescens TaxID=3158075 RepID=UPI003CCD8A75
MPATKKISAEEFKQWVDAAFIGSPADARSHCEQTMSPNYLSFQAGGDRTDFERAVAKIAYCRENGKKWETKVCFFSQDENKIAARLLCNIAIGDQPEKCMELMYMAELDDKGRFESIWEQSAEYSGTNEEINRT